MPLALEWICELHPELSTVVEEYRLQTEFFPLYALNLTDTLIPNISDITVGLAKSFPEEISAARAVAAVSFAHPLAASQAIGISERNAIMATFSPEKIQVYADRVRAGITHIAIARDTKSEIIACGQIQPVDKYAELLVMATLPAYRGQGYASAVISALISHAQTLGITELFLSAQNAAAARIYERFGFKHIGTIGTAERLYTESS